MFVVLDAIFELLQISLDQTMESAFKHFWLFETWFCLHIASLTNHVSQQLYLFFESAIALILYSQWFHKNC